MPELSTAPADSALDGTEKLLTLGFENLTLQQAANFPESKGTNIASAGTVNIGAATGPFVHITGTTTITAFDDIQAGTERVVVFDGALMLTHNGTSLILPTGANITTAAGDVATFRSEGSGNWRCVAYQRITGQPLAGGTDRSTVTNVSSSSGVVTLNYALGDYFTLTLTENVTSWVISNPPGAGKGFTLMVQITQDSTARTVAKPGTTAGGAALGVSTGSGDIDVLAITSFDNGTTLRSSIAKDFS